SEYPIKGRGGKGIKTANITPKNGKLVGLSTVTGEEDLMVINDKGVIIRFAVEDVSQTSRSTQGVRLMRMESEANVVTMAVVEKEEETTDEEE
ncbi:MAG: DNA gyrase subunit A, partial [Streptococcaceae bacterium]|nr:DNA gyrase subunit A [Streptococcaceae bacterium]